MSMGRLVPHIMYIVIGSKRLRVCYIWTVEESGEQKKIRKRVKVKGGIKVRFIWERCYPLTPVLHYCRKKPQECLLRI